MSPLPPLLLAYAFLLWLPGLFLLWRIPRCRAAGPGTDRPASVVIPARNEERRLAPLLESLARQGQSAGEVLVVDDASGDGTADLARAHGATVIAAPPKPEGWTGKSWACWKGAEAARGDVLVFLDADTRLEDGGLGSLLAEREGRGGIVSVQPYHEVPRPYEKLSAYCNVVMMAALGAFTPMGDGLRAAGAFGPCLAVSRADYFRCGGHRAVRESVAEDMALAGRAEAAGVPVARLGGRGTAAFRMYPHGARTMVEGWSRGLASGAGDAPLAPRMLSSAWITGATTAALLMPSALAWAATGPAQWVPFVAGAAGLYALYAAQLHWMLRRIGSFGPWTALAFPAPLAFFHFAFFRSLWMTRVRGRVGWSGREIPIRSASERRRARGGPS